MATGKSKLHELLAVHKSFEGQAGKCRAELMNTFEKKRHHFEETRKSSRSLAEGEQFKVEEQKDIQTTVAEELKWVQGKLASVLDVGYQIDIANTGAKADVVLPDGEIILKDVPATALLQMEKRLNEIHQLVTVIPTLDPAKGFKLDSERGKHIYKARDVEKKRTKKEKKVLTAAPATDKHPAQVVVYDEDVQVGTILEQEWSSLITPATKSDVLENIEHLTRAVQKARAKANEFEVDTTATKIGGKMLEFIFKPLAA